MSNMLRCGEVRAVVEEIRGLAGSHALVKADHLSGQNWCIHVLVDQYEPYWYILVRDFSYWYLPTLDRSLSEVWTGTVAIKDACF